MKSNYTREEVIKVIEELLQYPDTLIECCTWEDPSMNAEELLEMAEDGMDQ